MKLHYFQRYHGKENVATANTMLLLSRLYHYSPSKFYYFLKSEFFLDSFEPEIVFTLQEKSKTSIPDATITQESFKVIVETKLSDWFNKVQLLKHLEAFTGETIKVLITIAPELMDQNKKDDFEKELKLYNASQKSKVIHINTTFEGIANAMKGVIDDNDLEIQEVLDDYLEYCYHDNLITQSDAWKIMRVQLAGTTIDFNMRENVYYDNAERGFRPHKYLGLYTNKSVRAIGEITARITAVEVDGKLTFQEEEGTLNNERKEKIRNAIDSAKEFGYDLKTTKHRYFFVEKFFETDFKKHTLYPPRGSRIFNLTEYIDSDKITSAQVIANELKSKTWG